MTTAALLHLTRKTRPQPGDTRYGRSRVSNGKSPFVEADKRGPWSRRWRDLYDQIIADLGSEVTEEQRQAARRAATLCVECEKLEGKSAAGKDIDTDKYGMLSDRLGRAFRRLGLKQSTRKADATPGPLGAALLEGIERQQRDEGRRLEFEMKAAERAAADAAEKS
jgi:hypothetical protein